MIHNHAPGEYVEHITDSVSGPVTDHVINGPAVYEHHITYPKLAAVIPEAPAPGPHIIDPTHFVNHEGAIATHEHGWE